MVSFHVAETPAATNVIGGQTASKTLGKYTVTPRVLARELLGGEVQVSRAIYGLGYSRAAEVSKKNPPAKKLQDPGPSRRKMGSQEPGFLKRRFGMSQIDVATC